MPLETTSAAVLAILFAATLVRFTLGFGDALVGMPLLLLVVSIDVAAPLVALLAVTVAVLYLLLEWRHLHFQAAWRLAIPGLIGIALGLQFLHQAGERLVSGVLGAVIILFALCSLVGLKRLELKSERGAYAFGFLAGLLGGAYNTHGPPLVIYGTLRRWPPDRFRATLQGYFLPASIVVAAGHGIAGRLQGEVLRYYGLSLPLAVVTLFLGKLLRNRIRQRTFARFVDWFLLAAGSVLLVRAAG